MADKPDASDNNQQRNWLQRILDRWRVYARGDVIAGQVGEKASNVLIGKNIIQIGSIKIPRYLAILVTVGTMIIAVAALWMLFMIGKTAPEIVEGSQAVVSLLSQTPTLTATPTHTPTPTPVVMPQGDYNIAVSAFPAVDINGAQFHTTEAQERAISIVNFLIGEEDFLSQLRELTGQQVNIWGPTQRLPVVKADIVADQANALNVNILIYGRLHQVTATSWRLEPAFYVSPLAERPAVTVNELVGPYTLGAPIEYDIIEQSTIRDLTAHLQSRLHALTRMVVGLSYYERSTLQSYCAASWFFWSIVGDSSLRPDQLAPCSAIETFQLEETERPTDKIAEQVGAEVIYLFLGNAYVQIARLLYQESEEYTAVLDKARDAYQMGLRSNPSYSRLLNGLGNANYFELRIMYQNGCEAIDWNRMQETQQLYTQAIQNVTPSSTPQTGLQGDEDYVRLVATLGSGRLYELTYRCTAGESNAFDQAVGSFTHITEYYEQQPSDLYLPLTVYAHLDLAFLLLKQATEPAWQGDLEKVSATIERHLQTAVALSKAPRFRWLRAYVEEETITCQLIDC